MDGQEQFVECRMPPEIIRKVHEHHVPARPARIAQINQRRRVLQDPAATERRLQQQLAHQQR